LFLLPKWKKEKKNSWRRCQNGKKIWYWSINNLWKLRLDKSAIALGPIVSPNSPTHDYKLGLLSLNFQTNCGQVGQKNRFVVACSFYKNTLLSLLKKKEDLACNVYLPIILFHKGGEFLLQKNTFHTWKIWFSTLISEIQNIVKIHYKKITSCMPT
jgi:hypothetical protein